MAQEFGTTELEAQPVVGIRTTARMEELGKVMGPLFGEVFRHIQQHGQAPAGMPLAIYHSMDAGAVDLECAIPVRSPVAGAGRIASGQLPACTAATVTHVGPYQELGKTWEALTAWLASEGFEPAGAPWEVYVTDPGAEPDQSKWRTDLFFPVRKKGE